MLRNSINTALFEWGLWREPRCQGIRKLLFPKCTLQTLLLHHGGAGGLLSSHRDCGAHGGTWGCSLCGDGLVGAGPACPKERHSGRAQVGQTNPSTLNVLHHKDYFPQATISLEVTPDVQGQVVWQLHAIYRLSQWTICHLSSVSPYRHSSPAEGPLCLFKSWARGSYAAQAFALHLVQGLSAKERASQSRGCHWLLLLEAQEMGQLRGWWHPLQPADLTVSRSVSLCRNLLVVHQKKVTSHHCTQAFWTLVWCQDIEWFLPLHFISPGKLSCTN